MQLHTYSEIWNSASTPKKVGYHWSWVLQQAVSASRAVSASCGKIIQCEQGTWLGRFQKQLDSPRFDPLAHVLRPATWCLLHFINQSNSDLHQLINKNVCGGLSVVFQRVADTLRSVHASYRRTPICWESAIQRSSLTLRKLAFVENQVCKWALSKGQQMPKQHIYMLTKYTTVCGETHKQNQTCEVPLSPPRERRD